MRSGATLVRWVLRLYPRRFRERYAGEMLATYQQLRTEDARGTAATLLNLLFGAVQQHLAELRPGRTLNLQCSHDEGTLMDTIWQDVRYSLRMLARNPLFAVVSILTLAVGIGATTSSFHLVDSYFLAPPMKGPGGELVRVYKERSTSSFKFGTFSYPAFEDLRERAQAFSHMAAHRRVTASIDLSGSESPVEVELVSGDYFPLFGVTARAGRLLEPDDNLEQGAHPVLVVSSAFWQSVLGGDQAAVGRRLDVNGSAFTIVGVAEPGFQGTHPGFKTDLWVPIMMHNQARPTGSDLRSRGWGWLTATASIHPQFSIEQVRADLERVTAQFRTEHPDDFQEIHSFTVYPAGPLPDEFMDGFGQILAVMSAIVLLVLLVGCTNVASVLMGRVVGRRREIAVRVSLGSGRLRLIRLWVCEALILSIAGGVVGLVVALATHRFLVSMVSDPNLMPGVSQAFHWGAPVFGFTLLISLVIGGLFGLVPAMQAGRVDVAGTLKEEGSSATRSSRGSRLQAAFVAAQVAVSAMLLIGSGLLVRTLSEADAFDPGFETADILLAPVNLRTVGYGEQQARQFAVTLMKRLSSYGSVRHATYAMSVPLSGGSDTNGFVIPGYEPPEGRSYVSIPFNVVGPDYFRTLGLPILRGRGFEGAPAREFAEAVVSEAAAKRYWPGQDAVGQQFRTAGRNSFPVEVVGVAADANYGSLGERPRPFVYSRADQVPALSFVVHVKTTGDAASFLPDLKKEIAALEPALPFRGAMTFEEMRRVPLLPQRLMVRLTLVFSSMALLLTAVGIYGVVAQAVAARTQEIGVRMAFGGNRSDIVRMILRRITGPVAAGVFSGLLGAGAALPLMESLLFGVSATDPMTYIAVALLMLGVALAASVHPLRRATGVDPVTALRYE